MKKQIKSILGIITLAILVSTSSYAQRGLYFGIKGIPQISMLLNESDTDNDALDRPLTLGGAFGVGAGINLTDYFGVGVDLLYSVEGQRYETGGTETRQRLEYFKLPVMLTLNSNPNNAAMFLFKVGPQFSLLNKASLQDEDGDKIIANNKNAYTEFLVGGVAYLGTSVHITESLFLDAGIRADLQFINSEEDDSDLFDGDRADTKPFNAGVEIGLRFVL